MPPFPLGPILIFLLIFSSSSSPSSTTSFSGGILAQAWVSFGPTKPCLFAPCDAPNVLSIDPERQTVELLGPELDGGNK